MGIYGGSLVEANEQSVQQRQRKLKADLEKRLGEKVSGQTINEIVAEEVAMGEEEEEEEKSLLGEIWDIVVLETPVILLVIVLGQLIGHYEGWNIIER